MDAADRAEFFAMLQEDIQETDMWTKIVPAHDNISETLRVMMPVTDEGDPCLLEILTSRYINDTGLVILYTTMIAKIGPGYEALQRALSQWNLECPLGAFGIYETPEGNQLYHKYTIPFEPDIDPEELEADVMFHLMLLYEVISRKFGEARELSEGKA